MSDARSSLGWAGDRFLQGARALALWRAFWVILCLLLAARAVLPHVLRDYVHDVLDGIPEYSGQIGDIDLNLYQGAYEIENVRLMKTSGGASEPFFSASKVELSFEWGQLLAGRLVGEVRLHEPVLVFVVAESEDRSQTGIDPEWDEYLAALFPVDFNRFEVVDGQIRLRVLSLDPSLDLVIDRVAMLGTGLLFRSEDAPAGLSARVEATGRLGGGHLEGAVDLDPRARWPVFDLKLRLEDLRLTAINELLVAYADVDAERGELHLFVELAAADGRIQGYIKPILEHMRLARYGEVEDAEDAITLFWEAIVGTVAEVLESQKHDRLAARIPYGGEIEDPSVDLWSTIGSLLRNAFLRAIAPRLERSVDVADVAIDDQEEES